MKFETYDYVKSQYVEVKKVEKVWFYLAEHNTYLKKSVRCTDDCGFQLQIMPAYDFCCGLREFGQLFITSRGNVPELRAAFIEAVEESPLFTNIGALTYTRTLAASGLHLQSTKEIEFIEQWPGASSGNWFYNPNSGNMVQQWTLPVRQNQLEEDFPCEADDEY